MHIIDLVIWMDHTSMDSIICWSCCCS